MKRSLLFLLIPAAVLLLTAAGRSSAASPHLFARSRITDPAAVYAYDRIRDAILRDDPQETFSLETSFRVDRDVLVEALNLFINDTPECFWLTGGFSGFTDGSGYFKEVTLAFQAGGESLRTMRRELEEQVSLLLDGVSGSAWETALVLHDRLIDTVSYIHGENDQNAYGALVEHRSVCTGYAAAYQLLLNRMGISAYTVVGKATNSHGETDLHAWNLVYLGDGFCVYTDVTWDDHETEPYHYWFCRCLEDFSPSHVPDPSSVSLPDCGHSGLGWYELGHGLLLTGETGAADAAAYFTETFEGSDSYTADLCCEMPLEGWLNEHTREVIAALGYLNADTCGYRYHYQNSGDEYRLSLEIDGGTRGIRPALTPETKALPDIPPETDPPVPESSGGAETEEIPTKPDETKSGETGAESTVPGSEEEEISIGSMIAKLLTGTNLLIAGGIALALVLFCTAIAVAASHREKR